MNMSSEHLDIDNEAQWEHLVAGLVDGQQPLANARDDSGSLPNQRLASIPGWDNRFATLGGQTFNDSSTSGSVPGPGVGPGRRITPSHYPQTSSVRVNSSRPQYEDYHGMQHYAGEDFGHRQPYGDLDGGGRQHYGNVNPAQQYFEYMDGQESHFGLQSREGHSQEAAMAAFIQPIGQYQYHGSRSGSNVRNHFVGASNPSNLMQHPQPLNSREHANEGMYEVQLSSRMSERVRHEGKSQTQQTYENGNDQEDTSRTLFVRNISSNTEDKELLDLFGSYGDIRDMYSACKYRGFVMISFFDERAATAAMDCLQGKSLRRRKMDIHFSIPKENQVDAGILLVYNLKQEIPNTVIAALFQAFGDIKSIKSLQNQGNPNPMIEGGMKTTVRMIEYYDERHAAAALKSLNNADVWNIKLRIQYGRVSRVATVQQKRQGVRNNQHNAQNQQNTRNSQSVRQLYSVASDQEYEVCNVHMQQMSLSGNSQGNLQQLVHGNHQGGHQKHGKKYHVQNSGSGFQGPSNNVGHVNAFSSHNHYSSPLNKSHQHASTHNKRGSEPAQQTRSKSHFCLNLQNIAEGRDRKTTVMIRNIPNKYTQKMLLAEIDVELKGKYDFFYLPIDFKNKCNVGYAFMNLVDPSWILKLHEQFNGKRWSHFNSGKICEITYARIQGKQALMAHFRHSSLMQVDESCQPLLLNEKQEVEEIFALSTHPHAVNLQNAAQSKNEGQKSNTLEEQSDAHTTDNLPQEGSQKAAADSNSNSTTPAESNFGDTAEVLSQQQLPSVIVEPVIT